MRQAYADYVAGERRLSLLRLLAGQPDYALNVYVAQKALRLLGHGEAHSVIKADFAFLAEAGLAVLSERERVSVATLTREGQDVATGLLVVEGVARPSARA